MNPDFNNIGQATVQRYYRIFDSDRSKLLEFYEDNSMLTYDGEQFQGTADAIVTKLTSLPLTTARHVITTVDCQPTPHNGILVFVVGQLKTDNDSRSYSQAFHLQPNHSTGQYYVFNDVFRSSPHNG